MASCTPTAGEHSGRPPPHAAAPAPRVETPDWYPTGLRAAHLRLAAASANSCNALPMDERDSFRHARWVATAFALLTAWVAYALGSGALGSAANPEGDPAGVAVSAEPVGFTLVVAPGPDPFELTNPDPGELAMQPPASRSSARDALVTQLANEMDAIATRQALLARHRRAIPASPPSDLDLREDLERLNAQLLQGLPTAAAGAAIDL